MQLSQTKAFTLIIDEFQEFLQINNSIYSDMQNIWDEYKDNSKINLVLSGSIYSLMKKIFEDKKEPLFGRANNKIDLKAFTIDTLEEILKDNYPSYTKIELLPFYIFTGGVAKYVEIFVDKKAFTTYFSILSLIASSKTSRTQMESILEKNIGGYLERLENEYSIIKKVRPIFAKNSSIGRYWESKNQNEIDIVAINEINKTILIGEVKINPKKIDLEIVKKKAVKLTTKYNRYDVKYVGYSLEDL